MTTLGADHFPAFFEAAHGHKPFPWQARLARRLAETGDWPSLLDLPTGSGKTAAIDIAVFHLACQADQGPQRRAPLRILFVIDRRIVVDSAFEHARKIAKALESAKDGVTKSIADRLRRLSGDGPPLAVTRLRGGAPQERDWARSPAQPLVAVSTVDQVGSRLLFRGYGVSERMWPVHAGLVGADALYLLDEVHLSHPFEETLGAIKEGHMSHWLAKEERCAPFGFVRLSATPGRDDREGAFPLEDEDRANDELRCRLAASKLARIETITGEPASVFAHAAMVLAGLGDERATPPAKMKKAKATEGPDVLPAKRVGVVVNRVVLARAVFVQLRRELGDRADVLLLTGRIRPLDRDDLMRSPAWRTLPAGLKRDPPERPVIVVATQTIEAGADIDLDALATEVAPLDSLRQRFGRLDRLGRRGTSLAVILTPPKGARDAWKAIVPIYGEAARETALWLLSEKDDIDFGIEAFRSRLDAMTADELAKRLPPRAEAPVLMPAYSDLWATTSPPASATPEPSLFLHGPETAPDVTVIWRADIDLGTDEDGAKERRNTLLLDLCPPSALEAMALPLWTVRRWLTPDTEPAEVADVPEKTPAHDRDTGRRPKPVLVRREDAWLRISGARVRPGETIVVPARYGGADAFGWSPKRAAPVLDRGTEAHYRQRRKGALRVTRDLVLNACGVIEGPPLWAAIAEGIESLDDGASAGQVHEMLTKTSGLPEAWGKLLHCMDERRRLRLAWLDGDHERGFVLYAERRLDDGLLAGMAEEENDAGAESVTDRAGALASSAVGGPISLDEHLRDVAEKAERFARRAGLDVKTVALIRLAASLHDSGKADPRFQLDLHGKGALASHDPELAVLLLGGAPELLAKSGTAATRRGAARATPEKFRHEALSVALAEKHPDVAALCDDDRDLVLWLIGTHHGHGRPFFPPLCDPAPNTRSLPFEALTAAADEAPLRVDQGWIERAERLRRRFGPWELARLEAILRLADHAASAEEEQRDEDRASPKETVVAA